jgi:hypothetical protein
MNFVSFTCYFVGATTNASGLLTVYWDTNEIAHFDERVLLRREQKYSFDLPQTSTEGNHVLGFRIDAPVDAVSVATITNITLGFRGVVNQPQVKISEIGADGRYFVTVNNVASNTFVFVESSTNLVDWQP